jgi:hypothetical protein
LSSHRPSLCRPSPCRPIALSSHRPSPCRPSPCRPFAHRLVAHRLVAKSTRFPKPHVYLSNSFPILQLRHFFASQ